MHGGRDRPVVTCDLLTRHIYQFPLSLRESEHGQRHQKWSNWMTGYQDVPMDGIGVKAKVGCHCMRASRVKVRVGVG